MSDQTIMVGGMLVIFIFIGCLSICSIIFDRRAKKKARRRELHMYGKPKQ